MSLAEKLRSEESEQRAAAARTYFALIPKSALNKCSPAEEKKLREAVAVLGFNAERIEADETVVRDAAKLEADAAPEMDAKATLDDINERFAAVLKTRDDHASACNMQLDAMRIEAGAADKSLSAAKAAADKLKALRAQHWQLFAGEDPATARQRAHLAFTLPAGSGSCDADAPYTVHEIEQVLLDPQRARQIVAKGRAMFFPLPAQRGRPAQTDADVDVLFEFVRSVAAGHDERICLLFPDPADMIGDPPKYRRRDCVFHGDFPDLRWPYRRPDGTVVEDFNVKIFKVPGDDQTAFDKRLDALKKRVVASMKRDAVRDNLSPNARDAVDHGSARLNQPMPRA